MLTPEYVFKDITHITPAFLKEKHIKALLLDVDNTLTTHGSQYLRQEISQWLEAMKQAGIPLAIVSNNTKKRVEPFAKMLGLEYVSLGDGLKCIGEDAFLYTEPDTFLIPMTLVDIGPNALPTNFINSVEPEGGIRYVGAVAYQVAENLDRYEIKEGTVTLPKQLFQGNPATEIIIPASVKHVGERTFAISGITSIPDMPGVTRWPNELFYGCENLARVTIPEQVAYIGQDVFWECDAIWQVKYEAIDATIVGGIFGQRAGRPVEHRRTGAAVEVGQPHLPERHEPFDDRGVQPRVVPVGAAAHVLRAVCSVAATYGQKIGSPP